jgi:hypothetical protein
MAVLWIVACALVAAGSRWARVAVAMGIVGQVVVGCYEAARLANLPGISGSIAFWASFSLPMCVPLLPLVACRAERPHAALALIASRRWREALPRGGVAVAVLAATAVVLGNRALLDLLREGAFVSRLSQLFVAVAAASLVLAVSPRARAT